MFHQTDGFEILYPLLKVGFSRAVFKLIYVVQKAAPLARVLGHCGGMCIKTANYSPWVPWERWHEHAPRTGVVVHQANLAG